MNALVELLPTIGSIVVQLCTWALVVLGWLVVIDQTEYRELAKISVARLAALRELLRSIEKSAISFHTDAYDQSVSEDILRNIKKLSDEVADLKRLGVAAISIEHSLIDLRRAVTLRNFDSSSHVVKERRSELVRNIEACVDSVDTALMRSASKVCSSPRPLRITIQGLWARLWGA